MGPGWVSHKGGCTKQEVVITSYDRCKEATQQQEQQQAYSLKASFKQNDNMERLQEEQERDRGTGAHEKLLIYLKNKY